MEELVGRQGNRCIYCGGKFNILNPSRCDHFVPFVYLQSNPKENFVAACHNCNSIKNDKRFDSIEEVRNYLKSRGIEILSPPDYLPPPKKVCKQCAEVIPSTFRSVFCSPRCRDKSNSKNPSPLEELTRICAHCGMAFKTRSTIKTFCSNYCSNKGHPKRAWVLVVVKKQCAKCGSEFETGRSQRKYCSKGCAGGGK